MIKVYKEILKKEGISGNFMAEMLGITYGSYRSMTKDNVNVVPKWVSSFVMGYRLINKLGTKSPLQEQEASKESLS